MKRFLLLLILIGINYSNVAAQDRSVKVSGKYQNDLESSNLKGKVKSTTCYEYKADKNNEGLNTNWDYKSIYSFNNSGNIEGISMYNQQNRIVLSLNTYDKKGRIASTIDKKGGSGNFSEYSYNNKQNLIECVYSKNRLVFRFIYNKFGKRDTMYSYDIREKLSSKVIYNYDKRSNCIQELWYKSDGSLDKINEYIYDQQNKRIQESNYDSNRIKTSKIVYTYDKRNNLILALDSNIIFIGGSPRKKLDDNIYSRTFKYESFDKYGNWLKKSVMIDDKPVQITKREITYY